MSLAEEFLRKNYLLENFFYITVAVLSCYDICLTLDREVTHVWKSQQTMATVLFFGLRYCQPVNMVLEILGRLTWSSSRSDQSCSVIVHLQMAMDIIPLVCATVLCAIRISAIFMGSRMLFSAVAITGVVNPVIYIYIYSRAIPRDFGLSSYQTEYPFLKVIADYQVCSLHVSQSRTAYVGWMMAARAASFIGDALILGLTLVKTLPQYNQQQMGSIKQILHRDTILCFGILCIIDVIGLATGFFPQLIEIWQTWTSTLTSVLLARLYLDMREASAMEAATTLVESSCTLQSMSFAVGNVPLEPGGYALSVELQD
ncbi:hypothetical protein DAEQUDRAFT_732263 [Daedalea quercina L-15889]|uniref:DUF6533 domain-containing protein n=1 Tax=Daedalea quercina L-15889 TaxID=1314783 RepID=A0A165LQC6_9APHY|nr:hypothetical protein DAEQUDRAFT_732263 [Daedalea quercina L-15889]